MVNILPWILLGILVGDFPFLGRCHVVTWPTNSSRNAKLNENLVSNPEGADIFGWYLSNEKNPAYLGYIGDYTTQLCGDYSKPL